jgi:CMP-N-acetylneuraminic acid synthetase
VTLRVLGLIPARGGSRGVPGKNTKDLLGRPLLAWSVAAAADAHGLTDTVLSTEDDTTAALGEQLGVEVPFRRPAALAADTTPMLAVVQHALDTLEAGGREYDAVCLLQPTSPARPPGLIDRCIAQLDPEVDCVVTVVPIDPEHHPDWAWVDDSGGGIRLATGGTAPVARRQDLRPAYRRDGAVYLSRAPAVRRGSLYGSAVRPVVTDPATAVSIDVPDDWARAEEALRRLGR